MSNGFQLVAHDYNNSNVQQNLRLCNCSHKIFMCCGNTTALLRRAYGVRGRRYVSAGFRYVSAGFCKRLNKHGSPGELLGNAAEESEECVE
jgi:hypothetical protein